MSNGSFDKPEAVAAAGERILVTGGLGFIGAYLVKRLLDHGDEVLIFDSHKSYVSPLLNRYYPTYLRHRHDMLGGQAKIIEGDIRDYPHLRSTILDFKPNKVVHLAGLPIADKSDKYPHEAVSVNYNGTVNVLDAVKDLSDLRRFVNVSSSMVYGDFKYRPADEAHPTEPKGVYGATKLGAEVMTRVYSTRFGFPYVNVRPSSVYGPTDCNQRVSQLFLERALEGKPLILHNGGRSSLDFSYVEDVAEGILLATKRDDVVNDTFNLTRGEGRTLLELASIIQKLIPGTTIEFQEIHADEKRPERGAMDISRARERLGYQPRFSLEDGMERYYDFVKTIWR